MVLDEEQQLIAKLRKVEALFNRPGSDGERQAGESATHFKSRGATAKSLTTERCIPIVVATLMAALVPVLVCAQDATRNWPGVKTTCPPTVYVRDDAGAEVSGRLLRLDADAIVGAALGLLAAGIIGLPRPRVGAVVPGRDSRAS